MAKKIRTVASILRGIKRAARKKPRTKRTKEQKNASLKGLAKHMDKKPTAPERLFKSLLEELDMKFETQKIVDGKIFDFYIPEKNLIIEVDGNYFHAKDIEIKDMSRMQRKSVNNDKKKDEIAVNNGYQIERVWESDLTEDYELTKSRFKYLLID
jgi:very-short-patch-repair endonuclease